MAIHQLREEQWIKASIDDVWAFISDPRNLAKITPDNMDFKVLSNNLPQYIYPGLIIEYTVKPLPFFKSHWVSEITHCQEGRYFVDEQRIGPYKMWHHQHHIIKHNQGVLMTDIIHYQIPFGILGSLANFLFVKSKLQQIFDYRKRAIEKLF